MWRHTPETLVVMLLAAYITAAAQHGSNPCNGQQQTQATFHPTATAGPQELIVDGKALGKRIKTHAGLICLVCNKLIGSGDYVFRVEGQQVPVHRINCYAKLLVHPYQFLEILQPHGAFLGSHGKEQSMSLAWFLVGLYILTGLVFAALAAHQALHRGRSPVAWFGLGLAFSVFGYLFLLTRSKKHVEGSLFVPPGLGKVHTTLEPKPCPGCGKTNHPSAEQCAGCGAKLQPHSESEVKKAGF